MPDYHPIACADHGRLEVAIIRGQLLRTRWRDTQDQTHEAIIRPLDLLVREGAEWLDAADGTGHPVRLRLDRILTAEPHTPGPGQTENPG